MRTALGGGHGVDLVDDHGLDAGERLARRRREHQVQRLGRGDQQVGRATDQLLPVVGRRVARAHPDVGGDERFAQPFGRQFDPFERRPQVLLDVERQGPQRRDVEHPRAMGATLGPRRGGEPVDRGEERRERLARTRRRTDQRVFAADDAWPPLDLRRRRLGERRREPLPHGGRERLENGMVGDDSMVPKGCDSESGLSLQRRTPGRSGLVVERAHLGVGGHVEPGLRCRRRTRRSPRPAPRRRPRRHRRASRAHRPVRGRTTSPASIVTPPSGSPIDIVPSSPVVVSCTVTSSVRGLVAPTRVTSWSVPLTTVAYAAAVV